MNKYLSIDIGGTNIKYALLDHSGNIIEQFKEKTVSDKDDFLNGIDKIVDKYVQQGVKGLGFCSPGKIDGTKILFGGALPFLSGTDFGERYSKFNIPVTVINDGKANVLAESWLGNLKGLDNCAALTLGTGVGGGLIVNGKLLKGVHSQAGELSFIKMDPKDKTIFGMAGGYVSAVRMIGEINEITNTPDLTDGLSAFSAIKDNRSKAREIFEEFCKRVAYLIIDIQAVVDLKRIAIGGGISAQKIVVKSINKAYDSILSENEILRETLTRPEIVDAKFKNSANIYGSLYNLILSINHENL